MSSGLTQSERLRAAVDLPSGARYYRCALQINPFAYIQRHRKTTAFQNEGEYNAAIVKACLQLGIEVIGVTDHYRIKESIGLIEAAQTAGIFAFYGFEAVTKDGVHFLCLFDPEKGRDGLERCIGECGIHDLTDLSPAGDKDSLELLEAMKRWGGVCIAAHVAGDGGLLKKLSGAPRMKVWKSQELLACALAGPADQAPENLRPILLNKDAQHKRDWPIAIVNAQDVNSPDDLDLPGSSCYIKMSEISTEGLRQAFLDSESRIRLNSEAKPDPHAEFVAIAWEGGFLGDASIHFNENLNVLVGGRGTGKSTMIESIRYVLGLEPLGEDAKKAHEGVIRQVLRSGTKVSLLVRSHRPSQRCYTIERTIPNPAIVRDETGAVLTLTPKDVMPGVEVFGQHEISELTKSREKLTLLLDRFVENEPSSAGRKKALRLELAKSRSRIGDAQNEIKAIDERLAALPGLEETLKRFNEAGLEDKLKEKSLLVREERIIRNSEERLDPFRTIQEELKSSLPIDAALVSVKALESLPNAHILSQLAPIFDRLSTKMKVIADQMSDAITVAQKELGSTKEVWEERKKLADANYEKLLRELQKSKVDGEEFIRLRRQIEDLRPLKERRSLLERDLQSHIDHRRKLLAEWEDAKAADYRAIERAAKKVTKKLADRVRVGVTMSGNREPLEALLRLEVGGNLGAALERLKLRLDISLPDLAARCREGASSLAKNFGLPAGASERIASADPDLFMQIEELELLPTTKIELNTAADGATPTWQELEQLSTGQKATAVLLLLLLESESPLVVDQPEDDLDNRFITEGVVPIMRKEKRRRQFVFSTHNANIPVLGDAELIVGLAASGEARVQVSPGLMASIDAKPVRELVEEILEGGKTAFEMRRLKYGF